MKINKILVTGGAGYIGSHTVKELINEGFKVLVYDNLSDGHKEAVHPKAELVIGDIGDAKKLNQSFKRFSPDAVIHFAGFIQVNESETNPAKYYYNNDCFGVTLLESMIKNKVNYIIYSSSAGVYGEPKRIPIREEDSKEPINTYGKTKYIFEMMLKSYEEAYGLKWTALRYFNAAGASQNGKLGEDHTPETHILPLIIQTALGKRKEFNIFGNDYKTPDGTCVRDYIHVEDLASAHILSLKYLAKTDKCNIFNLGTGKGSSNLEVVNAVKKVSGVNFKTNFKPRRAGDPAKLIADPEKAIKELKWKPKYDNIERIIETAWNWHKNHPKGYK